MGISNLTASLLRSVARTSAIVVAATIVIAVPAWSGPAAAAVKVEFSNTANTAINNAGGNAANERSRMERDFNDALKELGKTNPAAQALYDSNQTIRIVCYGDPEAGNLQPATGILAEPAETIGDFDANGNPRRNGRAIIVIDCSTLQARNGFYAVPPGGFTPALFTVMTHELLHATHRDRRHPPDDLKLYRDWEQAFATALVRARTPGTGTATPTPTPRPTDDEKVGFAPGIFGGIGNLNAVANVSLTNTELPSNSGALGVIDVGFGEFPAIRLPFRFTGPTFTAGVDGDFTNGNGDEIVPSGFRSAFRFSFQDSSINSFTAADPGVTNGITYWEKQSGSNGISAGNAEVDATSKIELSQIGFTFSGRWDGVFWPNYSLYVGGGYNYTRDEFDQSASLTDVDAGFAVFDVNAMNQGHLMSNFPHLNVGGEVRFDVADRVVADVGWNSNIGIQINSIWGGQMTDCFISFSGTPSINRCPSAEVMTESEIDDTEVGLGFTLGLSAGLSYHITDNISARLYASFDYDANIPTLGSPTNLDEDGPVRLGSGDGHSYGFGIQMRVQSDRRLKTDIAAIGTTVLGLPLYRFRYRGETEVYVGVMAQDVLEVMPDAVSVGSDGFYRVDYGRLGLAFKRLQ